MIRLRPLRAGDESAACAAHEELKADDFTFLLGYELNEAWNDYLNRLDDQRRGDGLPDGRVQATFLAATVDNQLVGRVSIRHELDDWLAAYGGHIGYAVVPSQRRKGYAKEILRQALVISRALGVDAALVVCDLDNAASARTIEACGGQLESIAVGSDGTRRIRRYWIR